jgi:hypothetical protein
MASRFVMSASPVLILITCCLIPWSIIVFSTTFLVASVSKWSKGNTSHHTSYPAEKASASTSPHCHGKPRRTTETENHRARRHSRATPANNTSRKHTSSSKARWVQSVLVAPPKALLFSFRIARGLHAWWRSGGYARIRNGPPAAITAVYAMAEPSADQ